MQTSKLVTIILASSVLVFAIALISHPKQALEASIYGLHTWWEVVFPSLLPFFIIAEVLIGFGVVKFIGVLLEPLMRPLFRVPGVGGFVWSMGMASGNPASAKFIVLLREENQLTRLEAERLVAFTSCANPLFIFGAVAVGFFHNPQLGIILAISHYTANIFVGFVMRFYGRKEEEKGEKTKFSVIEAFKKMHETRIADKRPFGKLLGDAVISSINTLLMIGGFIILFSVVNRLLSIMNITDFFALSVQFIFSLLSIPVNLGIPFISGLFEMTIGSDLISETKNVTLLEQSIVVSFLLAFGGFSIQAQVASILSKSDIRFAPFFFARFLQGIFASVLTLLIWVPIYENKLKDAAISQPVFFLNQDHASNVLNYITEIGPIITLTALVTYLFIYTKKHFIK
ncbi:sporulation integral membrane protein YlbJ [Pallidibacillus pasinlerensis]|uniref:Sporulation integral membrane protein YlbJ n=1 Tax=Pallidibacillus pasinlerensis TaxID=2703818 RepID=A0ABW9ZYC2_9BACI|nr:sporulation integral membrane protein YlbJ [Pallidibacillus pasinlerensis]NCU16173.1 sporulation integral membrane protein YlbJ [Pallidibacillus pasinlerensis]